MLSEVLAPKQIREDAESLQIWGKDWTNDSREIFILFHRSRL